MPMRLLPVLPRALLPAMVLAVWLPAVASAEISVLADLRGVAGDSEESWLDGGLGKQRFADEDNGLQLGQAAFEMRGQVADTVNGKFGLNAYGDRDTGVDITEAWLQWKPLPVAGMRFKAKAGAFFPGISLENSATGWTSPWMASTSAINTWVGEELRTLGVEFSAARPGALHDSPHDPELVFAAFTSNDPAGALLTWRGWSVGDRVTGLSERLLLPDIPVFQRPYFSLVQRRWEEPFHEIDSRAGYYAGINYGYNGWFTLRVLHYDNRGEAAEFQGGQYAWDTVFDHVGLRLDLPRDWTLLAQYMTGETEMGNPALVYAEFSSGYLLLSKAIGAQRWSLRYDVFDLTDEDATPNDDNGEDGDALALAWQYAFNSANTLGVEFLGMRSERPTRQFLHNGNNPAAGRERLGENSLQVFYRWQY